MNSFPSKLALFKQVGFRSLRRESWISRLKRRLLVPLKSRQRQHWSAPDRWYPPAPKRKLRWSGRSGTQPLPPRPRDPSDTGYLPPKSNLRLAVADNTSATPTTIAQVRANRP